MEHKAFTILMGVTRSAQEEQQRSVGRHACISSKVQLTKSQRINEDASERSLSMVVVYGKATLAYGFEKNWRANVPS